MLCYVFSNLRTSSKKKFEHCYVFETCEFQFFFFWFNQSLSSLISILIDWSIVDDNDHHLTLTKIKIFGKFNCMQLFSINKISFINQFSSFSVFIFLFFFFLRYLFRFSLSSSMWIDRMNREKWNDFHYLIII